MAFNTARLLIVLTLISMAQATDYNPLSSEFEYTGCQSAEEIPNVRTDIECLGLARTGAQMVSYRSDTGKCLRSAQCSHITLTNNRSQTDNIFYENPPASATRRLLFAVKAGSGVSSNASYASSANCNNSLLLLPYQQAPTVHLWRSCWLDSLPELMRRLSLSKIVLHVIEGGLDVMNITFNINVIGLDMWNWFTQSSVISYYPASLNIPSNSFNYFSIQGSDYTVPGSSRQMRSFFINLVYGGCPGDHGYLVVMDTADPCPWAVNVAPLPKIRYNINGATLWSLSSTLADYLIVSVM